MPKQKIVLESPIQQSFRVAQVMGLFDVPHQTVSKTEIDADIPIEGIDWQIGLIVGPSGSGKTTIGRRMFPDAYFHDGYDWPDEAALVDGFPSHLEGKEITKALSSVGFSSAPHWLKRFSHLSNGQKFRCELARLMLEDHPAVIFDEFTSIVDRDAAKVSSAAVGKALRQRKKTKLIALSCHYDVIEWLDPDWIFDTANGEFTRRLLRRRPPIQLEIRPAKTDAWRFFMGHHYLTRTISRSAQCFVAFWGDNLVGFVAYLQLAGMKNAKRGHRLVVLPDYQGVGLGNRLCEWLASYLKADGKKYYAVTAHPAVIRHRLNRPDLWRCSRKPDHRKRTKNTGYVSQANAARVSIHKTWSGSRITGSFEYIGPALTQTARRIPSEPELL